ncbi:MAG: tetratricopeptide repeat protein [Sorangiineae bacterium]|nr:tetratricopeptide repeat protein [Polyangiaceae bacterium]MEB2324890.1 tetratricopeptide repeat protein [Sorangiineae bacterium]
MTADDDDQGTRRSRRARRREEQASENAESAATEAEERDGEAEERGGEAEERDGEAEERDGEAEAAAEPARAAPAPARKPRKQPRGARADEELEPSRIRDRNQRVRARAAARRRAAEDARSAGVAGPGGIMGDTGLARGASTVSDWAKKHFNVIQWVLVAALVGLVAWRVTAYRNTKQLEKGSAELLDGVIDENGRVGAETLPPGEEEFDPRKAFATDAERLAAAEQSYRAAAAGRSGAGTTILARLGLAGVLYDQGKYEEARAAYEAVKNSALSQYDQDVRGRSIEGIGMSLEAKGQVDAAAKTYHELENSDLPAFSALGLYHQARLALAKGDKDRAKQLVEGAQKKLKAGRDADPSSGYLVQATTALLRQIDPSSVPPPGNYTEEDLSQLKAQLMQDPSRLQDLLRQLGKDGPAGGLPAPPPMPAPVGSAP